MIQRRKFMEASLAGGLLFPAELGTPFFQAAREGAESRYQALRDALDREAMQRGWAREVDPDYHHAPAEAVEVFQDLKFGIRIHWGLYCMIGSHESWGLAGASREFWNLYNVLYQFFNPTGFDPDAWVSLFERAGIRFFTLTTKHHDGFCLWPTKTTHPSIRLTPQAFNRGVQHFETIVHSYSVADTPYKKDIVGMLVQAARRKGLGIGLYYSHVDWHDPAFAWDPFSLHYDPKFTEESDPARWRTFIAHEREQVRELMTQYGKVDLLCFDIGWPKAAAGEIAEIAKMVRKLQPNLLVRNRGLGAYGDFFTPERQIPEGPAEGTWMVIYPCGQAFSYLPNDVYKPSEWILASLISAVAKGGNFEVGFGPTPEGAWPQETVERLEQVGEWLKVNGEAIYNTRPRKTFREGDVIWLTRSKDARSVYAISMNWPGTRLVLRSVRALPASQVFMLGARKPLKWCQDSGGLVIDIPPRYARLAPRLRPSVFKISTEPPSAIS